MVFLGRWGVGGGGGGVEKTLKKRRKQTEKNIEKCREGKTKNARKVKLQQQTFLDLPFI